MQGPAGMGGSSGTGMLCSFPPKFELMIGPEAQGRPKGSDYHVIANLCYARYPITQSAQIGIREGTHLSLLDHLFEAKSL